MKHNKGILALALASVMTVSALAPSALAAATANESGTETTVQETHKHTRHGKRGGEKIAEPENAVGKDAAKEKALADAGVTAEEAGKVKSRVTRLDDGTVVYKVWFTYNGQRYTYRIDAVTGAVADKSVEDAASKTRVHGKRGGKAANVTAEQPETSATV